MKFSHNNLEKGLKALANLLRRFFLGSEGPEDKDDLLLDKTQPITSIEINAKKTEKTKQEFVPKPTNKGFLVCPIQGNDRNGKSVTHRTVKISSVLDHSGTAIDPSSKNWWGKHAKDKKVKAFNGEIGDKESSAEAPYGYTKNIPSSFFPLKEINYVGAYSRGDKYQSTFYLNYDGHAGYDFPYPKMTPVIAPESGELYKMAQGKDVIYGSNWDIDHSFYIKHENGYTTCFRHCEQLNDDIEKQILNDFTKGCFVEKGNVIAYVGKVGTGTIHLHFEVLNGKKAIVDPYADQLWEVN